MVIQSQIGPKDAGIAIGERLDELLSRGPGAQAPQGGAEKNARFGPGSLQLSQPLPLYSVELSAIQDDGFLAQAHQIGWRYLIFGQGPDALAMADVDDSGAPGKSEFARLIRGPIATRLFDAIALAEKSFSTSPSSYEIRVLEILELYVVAVWLAGASNEFIPVAEGTPTAPARINIDRGFTTRVLKMAQLRGQRGAPVGAVP
jgi:hypothetical protein